MPPPHIPSMHDSAPGMRDSQPTGLSILAAGRYRNDQGVDKVLHTHPTWEVVYYLEGRIGCRVGDRVPEVWPGVLLVVPPQVVHGEVAAEPWACYYLQLRGVMRGVWPSVVHEGAGEALGHTVRAMVDEWRSSQEHREQMLALLLGQLDILLRRSRQRRVATAAEVHVREFERHLEERSAERLAMPELAREVGVSYSYLRGHFVRLRGLTPTQRLHQLRCHQAIDIIRTSDLSLELVAESCGFASASHLSHHVLRATGKRPGAFRAARGA